MFFHLIGRTARVGPIPRLPRGRARGRARACRCDGSAATATIKLRYQSLPSRAFPRGAPDPTRSHVNMSGSRWKAVVPSTSAYGHGPRPSPCLLSRSRPCLLVAFTTHRTSAVARGPDPRRTAAATNATHDRRLSDSGVTVHLSEPVHRAPQMTTTRVHSARRLHALPQSRGPWNCELALGTIMEP